MPNHVTNILTFEGDIAEIERMMLEIQDDNQGLTSIDFNKIIPMPIELHVESSNRSEQGLKMYKDFWSVYGVTAVLNAPTNMVDEETILDMLDSYAAENELDIELLRLGKQCYDNIQKYGAPTWYEFRTRHWNTKWEAYGFDYFEDCQDNQCKFQTAWSAPHPVIEKLSEMYPDVEINHAWADENLGCNCGECDYKGGETIYEWIPADDSKEAYELSAKILGYNLGEAGFIFSEESGTYEYHEPDCGMELN